LTVWESRKNKPLPPPNKLRELDRQVNKSRTKLIMAALAFVDLTLAEMDALDGTESASAPAEFMILHESASEYRDMYRKLETERMK
jgi:hypothetical protein